MDKAYDKQALLGLTDWDMYWTVIRILKNK